MATVSHARTVHPANDDVVAIVGDGGHGADAGRTEDATESTMKLAQEGSEGPHAAVERVIHNRRASGYHHHQIWYGQVHHEVVGRCFQLPRFAKQIYDQAIA